MNEFAFALLLIGIILVFGIGIPIYLIGSWIYRDLQQWQFQDSWLNAKVWLIIILLTNYLGVILYLFLRKSFVRKKPCLICGYQNGVKENFCNQCGEPLEIETVQETTNESQSFKKLIMGGVSLLIMLILIVGTTIVYIRTEGIQTYSYAALSLGSKTQGGFGKEYRGKTFKQISTGKEVFHFKTKKDQTTIEYSLSSKEGGIAVTVEDKEGTIILDTEAPVKGKLTNLTPETSYKVTITIDYAKNGMYFFNWE